MSVWTRLFGRTHTPPQRKDAIESAFIAQSKALVEIVKQQQETLDRIVNAKYDRPVAVASPHAPAEPMPSWAMNDQGDVLPNLAIESDTEFLKTLGAK